METYRITNHAQEEMQRRQILLSMIVNVLEHPEQIVSASRNRRVYQSRIIANHRQYLLRVVVELTNPLTVVTVYRTSKIQKYWEARDEGNV